MGSINRENISSTGSLVASILAAICCIGPAIALLTGTSMGILGSLMVLDPFRPWLLAAGSVMLGYSFFKLYIRKSSCACDADVRARKASRILFWSAAFLFLVALTYQTVLIWIYG